MTWTLTTWSRKVGSGREQVLDAVLDTDLIPDEDKKHSIGSPTRRLKKVWTHDLSVEKGIDADRLGGEEPAHYAKQEDLSGLGVDVSGLAGLVDVLVDRVSALEAELAAQTGMIKLWSGLVANIPDGWALCDGNNGTPDLRGRFVVGAGGSYDPGDTGGAASVTLTEAQIPAHSHTGTAQSAGAHTHSYSRPSADWGAGGDYNPGNANPQRNYDTGSAGAHTHTLSIDNAGGGQSHENRPPYYALCFIMKL